ncbi:hypothetical protein CR513_36041, partial [Mucuna pruriens]
MPPRKSKPSTTLAKSSQNVSRGGKKVEAVYVGPYHMAHCQNRPPQNIFEKSALTRRIAHWQMALSKYDIVYTNQKAVKGRALVEQLAHHPLDEYHPLSYEFPNEQIMLTEDVRLEANSDKWKPWFDRASNMLGNGIGAVLAPQKTSISLSRPS